MIGPNKQPGLGSETIVLNFWPDRVTGVIYPDADDALELFSKYTTYNDALELFSKCTTYNL